MTTVIPRQKKSKNKSIKIASRPLDEQQIKLFAKHYDQFGTFPGSKIPCTVTGKLTTCVGPWMKKKIKEFGSAEGLLRGYICRQAAKKAKISSIGTKKKASKKSNVPTKEKDGRYDIPQVNLQHISRSLTEAELSKDSESICLRPDIFLNNGRHCDGCKYYKICKNRLKNLPKHITFVNDEFISTEVRKTNKK